MTLQEEQLGQMVFETDTGERHFPLGTPTCSGSYGLNGTPTSQHKKTRLTHILSAHF
jgi:hypothetical protein